METIEMQELVPKKIYTKSGNREYSLQISKAGQKILIANIKDRHKNVYKRKKWPAGRNQNSSVNSGSRYKHLLILKKLLLDKNTLKY